MQVFDQGPRRATTSPLHYIVQSKGKGSDGDETGPDQRA